MPPSIRCVIIEPPRAGRETAQVLESMVLIAVLALLVGSAGRVRGPAAAAMASYQVRIQTQPEPVQRMARELGCALEDVARMRGADGKWPAPGALAEDLVEPFAGPAGAVPGWELRMEQGVVNYAGPDGRNPGGPRFLLCIVEPPPGTRTPDHLTGELDEFHRRLPDGTVVHVGIWFHAAPRESRDALETPQREGWTEIVSGNAASAAR